jgi:spore coat protein U-like protein
MKRRIAVLLVLGALPWAGLYAADTGQTAQTTFRVSATVNAVCAITASDLAFGTYSAQSANALVGTTLLQATCTPQTTYSIGLNEGTSPGATVDQRNMVSGTNKLNYQLYSDTNRTTVWGTTPSARVTGVGTGTAVPHTVYGSVPAKQANIAQGIYGDTITVTIYY